MEINSSLQMIWMQLMTDMTENAANTSAAPKNLEENWVYEGMPFGTGSSDFDMLIQMASEKYGINSSLVKAVIQAESNFNPNAVSSAGAQGLMQLMPGTAAGLGVENAFDPVQNIDGGVRYLRDLLDRFDGNIRLTLAAYNAGPGAVEKYDGIPPYRETQAYVDRVIGYYQTESMWRE